ncbi:type-2 diacylglycerol acyltransferase [Pelomyxa schiedti]|nr:type-2 diacylglycerol acyltransferase [Pelomyxa schiedti]
MSGSPTNRLQQQEHNENEGDGSATAAAAAGVVVYGHGVARGGQGDRLPRWYVTLGACGTMVVFGMVLAWVPFLPVVAVACLVLGYCRWMWTAVLCCFVLLTIFPRKVKQWRAFCANPIFRLWCAYFRFSLVIEDVSALKSDKPYVIPEVPHGIFPVGLFMATNLVYRESLDTLAFGGRPFAGAAADVVVRLPLWRHIFGWLGVVRADWKTLGNELKAGRHVCVIPGGIAELMLTSHKVERVFLASRTGFVKLAMVHGCDLLPCYHFGNSQVLHQLDSPFLTWLSRKLRVSIPLCWGRYGLPIPFPARVIEVVGRPLKVPHIPSPTDQQVAEVHTRFVAEITRLFEDHKHLVGWEDRKLQVM